MDNTQTEIFNFLYSNALGKDNAKNSDTIHQHLMSLGIQIASGRTQELIRNLIKEMVLNFDKLIGSSNKGYYIISTKEDANFTIEDLYNRSTENLNRADKLKSLWNSSPSGLNDQI